MPTLNATHVSDAINSAKNVASVWLAEGQSSQRDMLASLQQLKKAYPAQPFNVIASHRSERQEIFEFADTVFIEPDTDNLYKFGENTITKQSNDQNSAKQPRWQFVLEQAIENNTKVLLTGRNSVDYEAQRSQFEHAGIRLLTGATSVAMLRLIEDKFAFIQRCQAYDIPVAEGWRFDTVEELEFLLEKHNQQTLCVKPVTGIFAQGFWRLDTGKDRSNKYDSFEHLFFTDSRKINMQQFLAAYRHSVMVKKRPIPMLLMPYLTGREYSIDVVCEAGEVLAAITRYKTGKIQHIGYDVDVMDVVIPLIRALNCDGIVSVQTKQNDAGQHCVLEINSRPSGGIGYTNHSGIDLTQIGFAYWLGLIDKPKVLEIAERIEPCEVRSIMTSVKIREMP